MAMDFHLLPKELTTWCSQLVMEHHRANGHWDLADLLWHKETRQFLVGQPNLQLVFRRASTTRQAKKAIEGYTWIITVILSLEVLASDFAGWGKRFPMAKREAATLVDNYLPTTRTRLLDYYLPRRGDERPQLVDHLTPSP